MVAAQHSFFGTFGGIFGKEITLFTVILMFSILGRWAIYINSSVIDGKNVGVLFKNRNKMTHLIFLAQNGKL